ncbi:Uncharacterised protein [Chromobacterium violaceum]|uniref:Uncharacterized protein n=1 Tax=Chromobacterium violaceum TaxID=536 RepID=A0A447TCP5_CHRVL|nr:Uncharacterised protein [Chromobacterium violaceum]
MPWLDWFRPMQYSDRLAGLRPNHSAAVAMSSARTPQISATILGV